MRISDWSSDVCSSDLQPGLRIIGVLDAILGADLDVVRRAADGDRAGTERPGGADLEMAVIELLPAQIGLDADARRRAATERGVVDPCQRVVMCAPLRISPGPGSAEGSGGTGGGWNS